MVERNGDSSIADDTTLPFGSKQRNQPPECCGKRFQNCARQNSAPRRIGQPNIPAMLRRAFTKLREIKHSLVLSLSEDGRRWFDNLTMSGSRRTLKRLGGL